MRSVRSNAFPSLFAGFLLLIGVAWALANPPGAGPDEPAHYVFPFAVLLPLWAGELLSRHRDRLDPRAARGLLVGIVAGAATVQAVAWYAYGRQISSGADAS
jgi:hypothetical protein